MKKINVKTVVLMVLTFGVATTSCSKDDNNYEQPKEQTVDIDVAVGTYKGTLSSGALENYEYFDAVIIVSKQANDKLTVTAKANEPYSKVTPKTFTVKGEVIYNGNSSSSDVLSLPGSLQGHLFYYGENKTIEISTTQQSATDIEFRFDGQKQ